ncbi:hypothetical protein LBMAG46_41120 [Planctomycetia bacterium]|nr:hypothetical protein LBMAG46_41120 [Planctomycetia bacterium]
MCDILATFGLAAWMRGEAMLVAECRLRYQRTVEQTLKLRSRGSKECFFVGQKTFQQAEGKRQLFRLCRWQENAADEHQVWSLWIGGGVCRAAIGGGERA